MAVKWTKQVCVSYNYRIIIPILDVQLHNPSFSFYNEKGHSLVLLALFLRLNDGLCLNLYICYEKARAYRPHKAYKDQDLRINKIIFSCLNIKR